MTVVHNPVPSLGDVQTPFARSVPAGTHGPVPSGTLASDGKTRTAQSFSGVPTVGPLYLVVDHVAVVPICTASVVHSTGGDVILTAAHCVHGGVLPGYHDSLAFIPGYHDGQAPYGVWETTGAFLDSRWTASENQDADAAFLTVARVGGGNRTLESLTGADTVRTDPPYTDAVTVLAYPMGAAQPIACAAPTSEFSTTQLRFACGGYANGSSGGPFLDSMDAATGTGAVIGVVGGYQQGGDSPDVSYAAYPGTDFATLYKAASGIG
jgi:V8-like Glu-specific endopeptidase